MNEVGKRLKCAREAMGLSMEKFAEWFGEKSVDASVICRIETGKRNKRYPPKRAIKKFAKVLSLTPKQLEALIAVERRGLDPCQMLPDIAPAPVKQAAIESEAEKILKEFFEAENKGVADGPIPIKDVIKFAYGLSTEEKNFAKEQITGPHSGALYGCFCPEGSHGNDRVVLVNSGKINGRRLSCAERRITIAHEAGHYFLHYGNKESPQLLFRFSKEPTYCRESEIRPGEFNLKEIQANEFAACLLMPRSQFKSEWLKVSGDESQLARHFGVTATFVRLRSKILNLL